MKGRVKVRLLVMRLLLMVTGTLLNVPCWSDRRRFGLVFWVSFLRRRLMVVMCGMWSRLDGVRLLIGMIL